MGGNLKPFIMKVGIINGRKLKTIYFTNTCYFVIFDMLF